MRFTEGQSDDHVHRMVVFFHKLDILSADLQYFIRTQKADKCEGIDGVQRQSCCGPPPLMNAPCPQITADASGFVNAI
jgi:hypothetical protein